jgi:hypothetical protein
MRARSAGRRPRLGGNERRTTDDHTRSHTTRMPPLTLVPISFSRCAQEATHGRLGGDGKRPGSGSGSRSGSRQEPRPWQEQGARTRPKLGSASQESGQTGPKPRVETSSSGANGAAGQAVVDGTALEDVVARRTRTSPRRGRGTRTKRAGVDGRTATRVNEVAIFRSQGLVSSRARTKNRNQTAARSRAV